MEKCCGWLGRSDERTAAYSMKYVRIREEREQRQTQHFSMPLLVKL